MIIPEWIVRPEHVDSTRGRSSCYQWPGGAMEKSIKIFSRHPEPAHPECHHVKGWRRISWFLKIEYDYNVLVFAYGWSVWEKVIRRYEGNEPYRMEIGIYGLGYLKFTLSNVTSRYTIPLNHINLDAVNTPNYVKTTLIVSRHTYDVGIWLSITQEAPEVNYKL